MNDLIDYADIQGLLRFGHGRLTRARFALLRVRDASAARAWLRSAPVTSAQSVQPPPDTALQLAFTAPGLAALGVPGEVIDGFSIAFRSGMAHDSRARQLGDSGPNAPVTWQWGGPDDQVDVLAMFYARPEAFDDFVVATTGPPWQQAFDVRWLDTEHLDGIEPFGFADGISEPKPDWALERRPAHREYAYGNQLALGEFVLGYRNEYGLYTDRPLLASDARSASLPAAVEAPDRKDLGRNGTYLVLRQLEQDVRGFWQFMHRTSGGDADAAEALAAAMVGRRRDGTPLAATRSASIPGIDDTPAQARLNRFTYDEDAAGTRCPYGAHVRRANPRNADFPSRPRSLLRKLLVMLGFATPGFRDDLVSSVRFHRILRRGRPYGGALDPQAALGPAPADEAPRGLFFVCLNANIARQFEFVQNAWMASSTFSGLTGESDPLLGNRQPLANGTPTCAFTRQRDGELRDRVEGLPRFVTVRGGAYFFLPGLRALRYIAHDEDA